MINFKNYGASGLILGAMCTLALIPQVSQAADHQEAPGTRAQLSADIGDYYAWHDADQLNLVLTFGTFAAPGSPAAFDSNLIYTLHFDTSLPADGISDLDIQVRYGQNLDGEWGIQVAGLGDTPIEGPVETIVNSGEVSLWSGVADDPFFFDLTGFTETTTTGVISFDPSRDDVAGLNVTAFALQIPTDSVVSSGGSFETWATTGSL